MNKTLQKIERIINALIVPSVFILVILVILQLFFEEIINSYLLLIKVVEWSILSIFIGDLVFKYYHVRKFKPFIKKYWLDILIVFPFFILFSSIERVFLFSARAVYSTLNLETEILSFLKDSEKTTETIRKINKIWPRLIRIMKVISYRKH